VLFPSLDRSFASSPSINHIDLPIYRHTGMGYKQDIGAHLNYDIEKWAYYRENTHRYFRLTSRNLALGFLFIGVIPVAIYRGLVMQQVRRSEAPRSCIDCGLSAKFDLSQSRTQTDAAGQEVRSQGGVPGAIDHLLLDRKAHSRSRQTHIPIPARLSLLHPSTVSVVLHQSLLLLLVQVFLLLGKCERLFSTHIFDLYIDKLNRE